MIAFEVSHNGKLVCIAGANDLAVLNAIVSASGKLGHRVDRLDRRVGAGAKPAIRR